MIDYEIIKRRLALIIPLRTKIKEIDLEITRLQETIDDLASVTSPGFSEHYGNPVPQDTRMIALISMQWDLNTEADNLRNEVNTLLKLTEDLPAFVTDHYVFGISWKKLEDKYGKSRQLMDYEFKRAIVE